MNVIDKEGADHALALVWSLCAIAVTVTAVRLFSRIYIVRVLSLDDLLIIPAVLFGIAEAVICEFSYRGRVDIQTSIALNFLQIFPFALSQMFARVSFAISLLELMGTRRALRWTIYCLMGLQVIVCVSQMTMVLAPCRQIEDYWVWPSTGDRRCFETVAAIARNGGQAFTSSADAFCDFTLACLPALVLSRLRVRLRVKLGLILLMSLGVLAGAAALLRMYYTLQLWNARPGAMLDPWAAANWTTAQEYVLLITVSIPGTWPLLRRLAGAPPPPPSSYANPRSAGPASGPSDRFRHGGTGGSSYTLGHPARGRSPPPAASPRPAAAARACSPPPRPPLLVRWWPRKHPGLVATPVERGVPLRTPPSRGTAGGGGGASGRASRSGAAAARLPITLVGPAPATPRGPLASASSPVSTSQTRVATPSGSTCDEYTAHARALNKAALAAGVVRPQRVEAWEEPGRRRWAGKDEGAF